VDIGSYPNTPFVLGGDVGMLRVVPTMLSTPVSYITNANIMDPFIMPELGDFQGLTRTGVIVSYDAEPGLVYDPGGDARAGRRYYYQSNNDARRVSFAPDTLGAINARKVQGEWVLSSLGPSRRRWLVPHPTLIGPNGSAVSVMLPYDPTNGTVSNGNIVRTQKEPVGQYSGQ
jgi:hypothetical protein